MLELLCLRCFVTKKDKAIHIDLSCNNVFGKKKKNKKKKRLEPK